MHITFNGVIAPYTYACPYAHKLRNIFKIYPPKKEAEETASDVLSAREEGILEHDAVRDYLLGIREEYDYNTKWVEWAKEQEQLQVEVQEFYNLDFERLPSKPEKGDYVSTRMDVIVRDPARHTVVDWKYGNIDYGAARYYDEVEFFTCMEAASNPDVGEWRIIIHFPKDDYTLPIKTYGPTQMSRLVESYGRRIDAIMSDHFMRPKPEYLRCRLCSYRSEEAGGCGECEYTVV